jgi:hypothetical protein|tara:strand:+ start:103 stop:477 length:375 start_codon:yes stop_codon:yes gene_type:complete
MVRLTQQVPTILSDWATSIRANNSNEMVNFYSQNAVLVGTYSQPLEVGIKQIRAYFEMFLDRKSISCKILDNINQEFEDLIISSGVYEFKVDGQKVVARYSYVFKMINNRLRIVNHHSSELVNK